MNSVRKKRHQASMKKLSHREREELQESAGGRIEATALIGDATLVLKDRDDSIALTNL